MLQANVGKEEAAQVDVVVEVLLDSEELADSDEEVDKLLLDDETEADVLVLDEVGTDVLVDDEVEKELEELLM